MVDQELGPVEIRVPQNRHWTDFEITPQGLIFTLVLALTVGALLGYYA
jgi:hypothetical protein